MTHKHGGLLPVVFLVPQSPFGNSELSFSTGPCRALKVLRRSTVEFKIDYVLVREEKGTQTQTFWSDIFQWGRSLPREGVGAKKFDTSLEAREIKLFGRDIPGFAGISQGCPKSLKKKVCVQFPFLN